MRADGRTHDRAAARAIAAEICRGVQFLLNAQVATTSGKFGVYSATDSAANDTDDCTFVNANRIHSNKITTQKHQHANQKTTQLTRVEPPNSASTLGAEPATMLIDCNDDRRRLLVC